MSKVRMKSYSKPVSLTEAYRVLNELEEAPFIVAGATDFIPRMRRPMIPAKPVVDISSLKQELDYICEKEDGIHIGAMATHTEISDSELIRTKASVLAQACKTVGSRQIRNRGTIAGNICNASPAGDSMPALLVLDAQIVLGSAKGSRVLPLSEFVLAPSRTALAPEELVTEIILPAETAGFRGWYKKMSNRNAVTISLVSAAVAVTPAGEIRAAFGSVAPTPIRFKEAEARYMESHDAEKLIEDLGELVKPISDVRSSAEYRVEMSKNLVREGFYELGILECK